MSYKDKVKVLQNCKKLKVNQRKFLSSHAAVQKRALEKGKTVA